jgi:hypothetical protein
MQKVYTDANLYDPEILLQTNQDITTIQNSFNYKLSESTVLILDVFYVEEEDIEEEQEPGKDEVKDCSVDIKFIQTRYHLADHKNHVVFFLDDVKAHELIVWGEIQNVTSETHLRESCHANA